MFRRDEAREGAAVRGWLYEVRGHPHNMKSAISHHVAIFLGSVFLGDWTGDRVDV